MHTVNCGFRRQYGHLSTIDKRPVRQRLRIGVGRNDALILIRNRYTQWPLVKCFLKTTSIHCIYTVLKPWLHHQKPTLIFKVSSTGQSCRCRFIYWTEYYASGMPENSLHRTLWDFIRVQKTSHRQAHIWCKIWCKAGCFTVCFPGYRK